MSKEQQPKVWKTGIDNPLYLVGAAGFAAYATLALTAYAAGRLIQRLPGLKVKKPIKS